MSGLFICAEGGEGSGKSTQVSLLADRLRAVGILPVVTHEPGDTQPGKAIRELVLASTPGGLNPRAEALLYAADRAQHVAEVIGPALEAGRVVISDRYVDSSIAYQAYGRRMDVEAIANLSRWATGRLVPDLTVVLDVDPEVGLARAARVGVPDRIEAEALDFHRRVRAGFLALTAAEPSRYLLVDASREAEVVAEEIWGRVEVMVKRMEKVA